MTLSGRLVRDGGGFTLLADDGRRLRLLLGRMPVDAVEKQVRVTGRLIDPDTLEAEGVTQDAPAGQAASSAA